MDNKPSQPICVNTTMTRLSSTSKLVLLCLFFTCTSHKVGAAQNYGANKLVEGMFVFGSSLVDNGNNNFLQTLAKANFLPYGIDFPHGPSGRFTNGRNFIDLLGEKLQLPMIPVFLDPSTKGARILNGVNYASGGSGILDSTGSIAGNVVPLNNQINSFERVTLPELKSQLVKKGINPLSKYIFVIGVGGNDYTLNFFRSNGTDIKAFTANLTTTLSGQVKRLYRLGGRKFVLMALYPIGCSPGLKRGQSDPKACVETLNNAAQLFNNRLNAMVAALKIQLPGFKFVIVDQYKIIMDIQNNPASKGFSNASDACCEVGITGISCAQGGKVCADRKSYLYFDGLHPTEAVNVQLAGKAFASLNTLEVYPINVQQLARL